LSKAGPKTFFFQDEDQNQYICFRGASIETTILSRLTNVLRMYSVGMLADKGGCVRHCGHGRIDKNGRCTPCEDGACPKSTSATLFTKQRD